MAAVDYRCVCGETVSLDTDHGGQCEACGRNYAADVLRNAAAETITVADLADANAVTFLAIDVDQEGDRIGQVLGHYRIVRKLGQGGMGNVYQALDQSLQRYVALKVIRTASRSVSDTRQLQRLFQEAIAQARVNHPNVVHIYFVGRDDESPFLAMELVGGPSLSEQLKQGPLPFRDVIGLALQLVDALRTCLHYDIIHGDIKPSNVLLTGAGTVKLSDFGLASRLSRVGEQSQGIAGTPDYLAPELATGQPNVFSDMYSLGVTLFEMTFGRLPYSFDSTNIQDRLQVHQEAPVEFPEPWPNDVPFAWKDVLARLLAKSPEQRYPNYDALMSDLKRLRPVALPNAGRLQRGLAWLVDLGLGSAAQGILAAPFLLVLDVATPFWRPIVALSSGVVSAVPPLLASIMQARWATTPGKKLFQIRIVDRHGLPPGKAKLAARAVIQMLPLWTTTCIRLTIALEMGVVGWLLTGLADLALLADAGYTVFGKRRLSLHDRIFDTRVVLDAGPQDDEQTGDQWPRNQEPSDLPDAGIGTDEQPT